MPQDNYKSDQPFYRVNKQAAAWVPVCNAGEAW